MKSSKVLLSILLLAPIGIATAEESHSKHTETDGAGTTTTTEKSHNDSVGWTGTAKSTSEASTVVDPKGLGNKLESDIHSQQKVKPNGDFSETVTAKHADGTQQVITNEKATSEHWMDKGKTTTTTHSTTVDPKGLGNKQEVETSETVDTNPDGTKKVTVTKEVNGEKVFEETKTR